VLTTHSMEEADVLCNRIAIVANGILRCIAPQIRLKSLYGGGYHLMINCMRPNQIKYERRRMMKGDLKRSMRLEQGYDDEENMAPEEYPEKVKQFVQQLLPYAELISDFNQNFLYLVPNKGFNASYVYREFTINKNRLKIADWGLS